MRGSEVLSTRVAMPSATPPSLRGGAHEDGLDAAILEAEQHAAVDGAGDELLVAALFGVPLGAVGARQLGRGAADPDAAAGLQCAGRLDVYVGHLLRTF